MCVCACVGTYTCLVLSVLTGLLQWNMVVSSSQAFYVKHSLPEKDLHSSLYIPEKEVTGLHWLTGSSLLHLTVNGGRGVVTPIRNMAAPGRAMLFRTMGGVPRRLDNPTEVYQMDPLYKWYFFKMTLFPGSGFINCSEGLHVHLKNDYFPLHPLPLWREHRSDRKTRQLLRMTHQ